MTCIEELAGYLYCEKEQSPELMDAAQLAVADTTACIFAGIKEESVKIAKRYVDGKHEGKMDAEDLALVYGTAAHVLDYDCQNHLVDGHDSVSITAVLLALFQEKPVSGKRFLEIYQKAVDVDSYLGMGIAREKIRTGWNGSSMLSVFGCAAAAGLLMELNKKQMESTLSLALLNCFGLTASFGYLSKDVVIGRTASTGIYSARMAKAGMEAPLDLIESSNGYGMFYFDGIDTEKVKQACRSGISSLKKPGLSYKKYPVCFSVQTGYQVIRRMNEKYHICAEQVEKVVGTLQYDMAGVRDNPIPKTAYPGKFDLRYCIALELLGKAADEDAFTYGKPRDEEAAALCERIELVVDTDKKIFNENCFCGVRLEIYLNDGQILSDQMEWPKGGNQNPMEKDEIKEKIYSCLRRNLEKETAEHMMECMWNMESTENVQTLCNTIYGMF